MPNMYNYFKVKIKFFLLCEKENLCFFPPGAVFFFHSRALTSLTFAKGPSSCIPEKRSVQTPL